MNFLRITDFSETQILEIFDIADKLLIHSEKTELSGKTAVLFFPESSIRTRITFEKGIVDLGGHSILFPPSTLDKREELKDVIRYLENWADLVIIRHSDFNKPNELATYANIPIINAMTSENHPCEILSDIYSLRKIKKDYRDLIYTFVGEKGNISKTWVEVAQVLNLKLNHVGIEGNRITPNNKNYSYYTTLEDILPISDVILTDPLSANCRNSEYIEKYQITLERMKMTKRNALLNPCPPFFRNEEVSEDVIESHYFVGYEFKKDLVYIQQAIILYCLQH